VERLVCLGLSHRTAPVELRERFGLLGLGAERCPAVSEHAVLATCYRVELYAHLVEGVANGREALLDALADAHGVDRGALLEHLYVHTGGEVARHLSRVAAGLDSLVLGEAEILGQVRTAFEVAADAETAASVLTLLFRTAIAAGRRARAETAIGASPATASSMALSLAEGVLGELRDRRVLVIGAGRIGVQTVRAVSGRGIERLAVANRTRERAAQAAAGAGGLWYGLDELEDALLWADVAITATASEEPVVRVDDVRPVVSRRAGRPLVLVDLAVPADVARDVGDVPGVRLFDVDDLRAGLDTTLASRLREVPAVEAIVDEEVATFTRRYRELEVEPLLAALRRQAEAIRERELERALGRLGDVDEETAQQMAQLSRSLVTKLLHEPTVRLRELAAEGGVDEMSEALRELYGIAGPHEP
jgi:glutamyl-tRNA reductase